MKLYRLSNGAFVGTQAEAKDSKLEWEPYEFPINPKEDTIKALNELVGTVEEKVDRQPEPFTPPALNETDAFWAETRGKINSAKLDFEEILWRAPLDTCIRLGTIVMERTREHFTKLEKKNDKI